MSTPSPARIGAMEVWRRLEGSSPILLVCAYRGEKFKQARLKGAISLEEFEASLAAVPKRLEIAFY